MPSFTTSIQHNTLLWFRSHLSVSSKGSFGGILIQFNATEEVNYWNQLMEPQFTS
jgi:hypothetical protein